MWVFNYYFNNLNEKYHQEYCDSWFYEYNRAPLFNQIYDALTVNNYIFPDLKQYKINKLDYFNTISQMIYVTPKNILMEIAPPKYMKYVNTMSDINDIVNIVDNNTKNDEIDCIGATFMSKCHLKLIEHISSTQQDLEFIKTINNIN